MVRHQHHDRAIQIALTATDATAAQTVESAGYSWNGAVANKGENSNGRGFTHQKAGLNRRARSACVFVIISRGLFPLFLLCSMMADRQAGGGHGPRETHDG